MKLRSIWLILIPVEVWRISYFLWDVFAEKFEGSNENILTFSLGDNDEILDSEIQLERQHGYLQLSTNYRTNGKLILAPIMYGHL